MHVGIFNYVEKQRPCSAAFTTSETLRLDIFVFQDSEGYITREKDIALHFFRECRTHIDSHWVLGTELEEAVLHCSPVKPKFVGLPASHNSAQPELYGQGTRLEVLSMSDVQARRSNYQTVNCSA